MERLVRKTFEPKGPEPVLKRLPGGRKNFKPKGPEPTMGRHFGHYKEFRK